MLTHAGRRSLELLRHCDSVLSHRDLSAAGVTWSETASHLAARRWQSVGRAIVLHAGEPTRAELCVAALINCGPRSVLASLTAAESVGLKGWERDEIHVLAPAGVPRPKVALPIVLHRAVRIEPPTILTARRVQRIEHAAVLAAGSWRSARPGCGLLAATVQQRLTTPAALRAALTSATRVRHRAVLRAAVDDIGMGAHALSEIDFARLCRKYRLPAPTRQAVRRTRDGKRRYLDVEWALPDGRRVVVEIDGALHLAARSWFEDQLRQNAVALHSSVLLRFPSVIVRTEESLVVEQLAQALGLNTDIPTTR